MGNRGEATQSRERGRRGIISSAAVGMESKAGSPRTARIGLSKIKARFAVRNNPDVIADRHEPCRRLEICVTKGNAKPMPNAFPNFANQRQLRLD
jgi:hypothetical protein